MDSVDNDKGEKTIGIRVNHFLEGCQDIKEMHPDVSKLMLKAIGLQVYNPKTKVNWNMFLKIQSILRYYTATKDVYFDFWMRFFNPNNFPQLPRQEVWA